MEEIKQKLLETIKSIDTDKLSLSELSVYMDICKKMKELDDKSYLDALTMAMTNVSSFGSNQPKVADLK